MLVGPTFLPRSTTILLAPQSLDCPVDASALAMPTQKPTVPDFATKLAFDRNYRRKRKDRNVLRRRPTLQTRSL